MNTQLLQLNDQNLQSIHGGGLVADITDAVINFIPGFGEANRIAEIGRSSVGQLVHVVN